MKTCLLSGNFALDTIVTRDYPNGFVIGKSNKFTETLVIETVGNTCGNVACMLAYLGVQTFPIAHLDLSEQGLKIKADLQRYGADVRFVENSECGGTTLLRCTHKRDKTTGEHTVSFRATSPGSRFPKRRFLRVRDEARAFMESLDFTPDIFFFDAAEAGLRYLAGELRKRGTLVYFEPESDADKNKFLKAIEVSDIIKFSHEKVGDISFTAQYKDKLFIRTMGAEGLEFNLCGQGWAKVASVPNDNVVDWEGAGDWTTSQFIACLCERDILPISQMTTDSVRECLEIACATASHSVSYLGSKGMIDVKKSKIKSQFPQTYDRLMYGVIAGDMIGKPYERRKDSIHTTNFPLFEKRSKYTDDTILTVAIMDWLMADETLSWNVLEQKIVIYTKTSKRFKGQSRCFSNAFAEWVKNKNREKGRVSDSNGAVMRVTPVGWFFNDVETIEKVAEIQASLTHNHPDPICGAKAVAVAVFLARQGRTKDEIREFISSRYDIPLHYTSEEFRSVARWTSNGKDTAQQALISFLCTDNFEDAIRYAVSLGTDSDTVGAIVGGIAEAFYRGVPEHIKAEIHRRAFPDEYWDVIRRFAVCVGF